MKTLKTFYQKKIAELEKVSFWSILFWPFSLLYFFGYSIIRFFYRVGFLRQKDLPKKVISIGNLTVGGTGKTPFVVWMAEKLKEHQKKPVILTRGYGLDEVDLLEKKLPNIPVLAGKNRFKNATQFLEGNPEFDYFILDDGFQHWNLNRDLDVLIVNALNPFGDGFLLPAGILREPRRSIERADLVVLTHADKVSQKTRERLRSLFISLKPNIPIVEATFIPTAILKSGSKEEVPATFIQGRKAIAFCGIGYPAGFRKTLEELSVELVDFVEFLDHEDYNENHIKRILDKKSQFPDAIVITTEKDFERNPDLLRQKLEVWVLKIKVQIIRGEKNLNDLLVRL